MSKEVIEALRKQAQEIAGEGHFGWGNTMTAAADAIDALLAERDSLKKDAERYRFLMRELAGSVSQVVMGSPIFSNEDVDAAIDAALQGEQP